MDIYISRDGQTSGPFSEETVRALLRQGDVTKADLGWHEGAGDWTPLSELLADGSASADAAPVPEPAAAEAAPPKADPATPKQKAFLSYFGIAMPADLSRDQAARLVSDAMEDAKNSERLARWNTERMKLHPELFAADPATKKETRVRHFLELCQGAGAKYVSGVTQAHCQVLVSYLDVKFPHWDAQDAQAAEHYFYPAVAEKFPQLMHKQWRGRLQYGEGPKPAPEAPRRPPVSKSPQKKGTTPLVAISRGLVLGLVILGALYLVHQLMESESDSVPAHGEAPASPPPAATAADTVPPKAPALATATTPAPQATEAPPPAAIPTPEAAVPPPMEVLPAPVPESARPAKSAPAPIAIEPAPAAPVAADPPVPTAVDSAPMAVLPGAEPPVPLPPPPATLPTADSLPPAPAVKPPPAPGPVEPPAPPPAVAPAKTNLLLTKRVEVQLSYGKMILPPGTPVKLVSRHGAALKVSYQNQLISVPVASTDLE